MGKILHLFWKAVKVYKEKGAVSLLQRIFLHVKKLSKEIFLFLKYPKKYDILYVSGCSGGSKYYRCYNQAEELKLYGLKSVITSQHNSFLINLIKKFDIFIFQRVIYNPYIEEVIKEIKKQRKIIIFETDDLVFAPEYIPYMHYYNYMSEEERSWYQNGIGREILEDPYITNCILSTRFLAKTLKKKYPTKNIFVSTNKLNKKQVAWAEKALKNKNKIKFNDGRVRIGYFSGSKSHDRDFATIYNVVLEILKENKNVILMIVGYLDLNDNFLEVKNQIERYPFVSMKKLSELILRSDINIAPLEIDNPFCQAKSGIKFFEAGILGVPTIASATDSFKDIIENGKNGFIAESEENWYNYLRLLIKNEELRREIGEKARVDSLRKHTANNNHPETKKLVEFIKSNIRED